MLGLHHRLAISGVAIATAVALPTAALASGWNSGSGTPKPAHATALSASNSPAPESPDVNALAAEAGISAGRLRAGLRALKQAGGNTAAGIAAFAAAAGVSHATAQRIVSAVTGPAASGGPGQTKTPGAGGGESPASGGPGQTKTPGAGISKSAAPGSPDVNALAAEAGISVSKLRAGLVAVKRTHGSTAADIAAFAAATGVSHATAQHILSALSGA